MKRSSYYNTETQVADQWPIKKALTLSDVDITHPFLTLSRQQVETNIVVYMTPQEQEILRAEGQVGFNAQDDDNGDMYTMRLKWRGSYYNLIGKWGKVVRGKALDVGQEIRLRWFNGCLHFSVPQQQIVPVPPQARALPAPPLVQDHWPIRKILTSSDVDTAHPFLPLPRKLVEEHILAQWTPQERERLRKDEQVPINVRDYDTGEIYGLRLKWRGNYYNLIAKWANVIRHKGLGVGQEIRLRWVNNCLYFSVPEEHYVSATPGPDNWPIKKALTLSDVDTNHPFLTLPGKAVEDHVLFYWTHQARDQLRNEHQVGINARDHDTGDVYVMKLKWRGSYYNLIGKWGKIIREKRLQIGREIRVRWDNGYLILKFVKCSDFDFPAPSSADEKSPDDGTRNLVIGLLSLMSLFSFFAASVQTGHPPPLHLLNTPSTTSAAARRRLALFRLSLNLLLSLFLTPPGPGMKRSPYYNTAPQVPNEWPIKKALTLSDIDITHPFLTLSRQQVETNIVVYMTPQEQEILRAEGQVGFNAQDDDTGDMYTMRLKWRGSYYNLIGKWGKVVRGKALDVGQEIRIRWFNGCLHFSVPQQQIVPVQPQARVVPTPPLVQDHWPIRKILTSSDVDTTHPFLPLPRKLVEEHILAQWTPQERERLRKDEQVPINVRDYDTGEIYGLRLKWRGNYYNLIAKWANVIRHKGLGVGQEIRLRWVNNCLYFSVPEEHYVSATPGPDNWPIKKALTLSDVDTNHPFLTLPGKAVEDHILFYWTHQARDQLRNEHQVGINARDHDTGDVYVMKLKWRGSYYNLIGKWGKIIREKRLQVGREIKVRWDNGYLVFSVPEQ
ncbi:hypothetical protein C2S52_020039 [Perilla frutescens var. hirtella]|nr:hypothetical protein C2S52_020039 [Perilla frutescens var. hirtella]